MFSILSGLMLMALGTAMLRYNRPLYNFTGNIDFVERWVAAGTPAFLKLLALAIVIFGLGTIFGLWTWLTQPLAEGVKSLFGSDLRR